MLDISQGTYFPSYFWFRLRDPTEAFFGKHWEQRDKLGPRHLIFVKDYGLLGAVAHGDFFEDLVESFAS